MTASIVAQTTAYRSKYSTRSHAVCGSNDGLVFSAATNKGACFVCPKRAPGSCGAAREPVGEACNKSTQSRYLQLRSVLRQHLCGSVSIITIECRTSRGIIKRTSASDGADRDVSGDACAMCEQSSLTLCPFVLCVRGVQNQATVWTVLWTALPATLAYHRKIWRRSAWRR